MNQQQQQDQQYQRKPLRFVAAIDGGRSGVGDGGKPWRQQTVLVHQGDEVRKVSYFLRDNEPFLEPGEYVLAPDAVYVGDKEYTNRRGQRRSEPGLLVAPRFIKRPVPVSVPKTGTAG